MAQKCYYRFDRNYGGPSAPSSTMVSVLSGRTGHRSSEGGTSDGWCLSVRGGPVAFDGPRQYVGTSVAAPIEDNDAASHLPHELGPKFGLAVSCGWQIRQVDINNTFLNGDLTDEVFMQKPPGYVQLVQMVLYELCQAPRAWFDRLKRFLISIGFLVSKSDASLFIRVMTESVIYVLVYMDDIIITGSMADSITSFIQLLDKEFSLKDMGELHYFLGVKLTRSSTGSLHLCQRKYIRDLLDKSSLTNAKSAHTPIINSSALSKNEGDRLANPTEYQSITGALQYVVLTQPDIAYAVNHHGLIFRPSNRLYLVGYADANWGLDFDDRRSTTGHCVYLGDTPVLWCSKKQQVVSRSIAEAKYRSLDAATTDVTWLVSLLTELQISSADLPTIWCDNSGVVVIAANLLGRTPAAVVVQADHLEKRRHRRYFL
ncbi:hypothetical protein CXB51_006933 [Gossypium anomalum]|uniref:Reverse transcriptase Ty1/copia-type domain-containing protein n=1 Tax=Gossypium anomalum TaxID=47600 RepID=A0A8J5Z1L2_9ROSI|nr:hypothetical protein CXB51_006933 [Gossypium anomalum]